MFRTRNISRARNQRRGTLTRWTTTKGHTDRVGILRDASEKGRFITPNDGEAGAISLSIPGLGCVWCFDRANSRI